MNICLNILASHPANILCSLKFLVIFLKAYHLIAVSLAGLIFLNKAFRGRYLLIDGDHGVLGRDVLNSVALVIDGPHQEWSQK